jgi:hypothetical protein
MIQPLYNERLTRKFFMNLPEGVYLVSGVGYAPGVPVFGETVLPVAEREAQWQRIREARVNGRLCDVFRTQQEHAHFSAQIRTKPQPQSGQIDLAE